MKAHTQSPALEFIDFVDFKITLKSGTDELQVHVALAELDV